VQGKITRQTRFEDLPDLLSVEETRAYLALGRSTMYELLRRKELAYVRFGRLIRIPRASLEKFVCGES
jgi:excisionase family DNA binding protein